MQSLVRLIITNPVMVHMITIAVIVFGVLSLMSIPQELDPDMSFNWAIIWVAYPGVSPEEIEKLITKPIEDEIADVDKIDSITSVSSEGISDISVKFDQDISRDEFEKRYQDLRTELDKVTDLPADAEDPVVFKLESSTIVPVISVVLAGDLPEKELRDIAEDLQDRLETIDDVSAVNIQGIRDREIWVEVDPDRLNGYNLALSQVVQALAARNLNVPGGKLKVGRSEYLLRTVGEFDSVEQVGRAIVRQIPGGGKIRVSDVATVADTFEEPTVISRLDGKPSITLTVAKRGEGSTIAIINEVRKLVKEYERTQLPETARIGLVNDTSIFIRDFISKLEKNALFGVFLVLVVLYLFMGVRNAAFVAIGIPVTLLIVFTLMQIMGSSINGSSLFALVLMLGIIVDDAIVVMENVFHRIQRGESPRAAAINGTLEVGAPVISATLTTVAAFLPLALLPGIVGKYMRVIPIIVGLTLAASLFECFFILPTHIGDWGKAPKSKGRDRLMKRLVKPYTWLLAAALRRRYVVLGGIVLILILSMLPLIYGVVKVDMFQSEEIPQLNVNVTMPTGARLSTTDAVMRKFEQTIESLPKSEVKSVITWTGMLVTDTGNELETHLGSLSIELVEAKYRERSMDEIINDLRQRCSTITGPEQVEFKRIESGPPTGGDVEVLVKGEYFDELEKITDSIKAKLAATPGVMDVNDNFTLGKEEIRVYIDEDKADEYGLTTQQIAFAVRNAFEGGLATVFREGDEEIDVVVKYAAGARTNIGDIENMKLVGITGALVPLRDVAHLRVERGYSAVHRYKQERAITITANVDQKVITTVEANQVVQRAFDEISGRYPGYTLEFGGQFAEFQKAFAGIIQLFLVGVLLIYFILGSQFKSFIQPIIIMITVPFAFIGAMVGLIFSGNALNLASMYGFVALAGIVVNDSIVLVEFINRQRAAGVRKWKAILTAGQRRLRPILLTSITTICGLLPMALGIGGRSEMWMPMASTIVWGLSVSTLLTLFVVPSFYAIVDDMSRWRGVRVEAKKPEPSPVRERKLAWATETAGDD